MNPKTLVAFVVLLRVLGCVVGSVNRTRQRVLYGETLVDRTGPGYAAIKYFVWIGYGREVHGFWDFLYSSRQWLFNKKACGGALLTTQIVQTAGHCVSDYREPLFPIRYKWCVRSSKHYEVVVGSNEVSTEFTPIGVTQISIHPLCAEIKGLLSHDFALMTLEKPVKTSATVQPAPFYMLKEMAEMWTTFHVERKVCLRMGFGVYERNGTVPSKVLRHGWMVLRSYIKCFYKFSALQPPEGKPTMQEYQEYNTWSCLEPVRYSVGASGDSGSPISCDNIYFALYTQVGDYDSALVFHAYANSREWRDYLIMNTFITTGEAEMKYTPPRLYDNTGSAPPNKLFAAASSASALTMNFIFLAPSCATAMFLQVRTM